ncbi:MAG TPA: hypothetical protein VEV38_06485 [Candidatus Eremiobacteraceae bacterium]|nr:hypothetical protein [Candidatus Eremiobacteraceae bacterium]
MKVPAALGLAVTLLCVAACGGDKLAGTYQNENGSIVMDLKSGGTGDLTIAGETKPCTYTSDQQTLKVTCDDNEVDFTVHDDGSLTGPPDSFVGDLKKTK